MEMTKHASFMYTTEIENLSQLCYRAFDNSNYDVRCTVAKLLGFVLATTQNPPKEFVKGKVYHITFALEVHSSFTIGKFRISEIERLINMRKILGIVIYIYTVGIPCS